MAQFSRLEVLNQMIETGLVPIFYNGAPYTGILAGLRVDMGL